MICINVHASNNGFSSNLGYFSEPGQAAIPWGSYTDDFRMQKILIGGAMTSKGGIVQQTYQLQLEQPVPTQIPSDDMKARNILYFANL